MANWKQEKIELTRQILEILDTVSDEDGLEILSEVVAEYDLNVAATLIKDRVDPLIFTKVGLEEKFYSEGNEDAGHIPLKEILEGVAEIINTDESDNRKFVVEDGFVRSYTQEELVEEGKENDKVSWYKVDKEDKVDDKLIGFKMEEEELELEV